MIGNIVALILGVGLISSPIIFDQYVKWDRKRAIKKAEAEIEEVYLYTYEVELINGEVIINKEQYYTSLEFNDFIKDSFDEENCIEIGKYSINTQNILRFREIHRTTRVIHPVALNEFWNVKYYKEDTVKKREVKTK